MSPVLLFFVKFQATVDSTVPQQVQVARNNVDFIESLTYLGSPIDGGGRCEAELVRRTAISRNCNNTAGSPHLALQSIYVNQDLPLLRIHTASNLYGAETWTMTKAM